MKKYVAFPLIAFLVIIAACRENAGKPPGNIAKADTNHFDSAGPAVLPATEDSLLLAGQPLSYWINDKQLSEQARDILQKRKDVDVNASMDASELTDSIFSVKDSSRRIVYFYAFTRTLKFSDGAYSEGAGMACMQFVKTDMRSFCAYFAHEPLLTRDDISLWAKFVFSEIIISCEGHENNCTTQLFDTFTPLNKWLPKDEFRVLQQFGMDVKMEETKFYAREK